ncbi:MFS transporter small subunit [Geodermatophilus sp. SYSU D00815]
MSSSLSSSDGRRPATHTPVALIVFAWVLVGIPLLYGLVRTIQTASALFTG